MSTESSDAKVLAPPYVSFKTLLTLFDRMQKEGIPPRIDRSFLVGMSGGYQTQVLNALRYLGLIRGEGDVESALYELVDPETRKKALADLLQQVYPEASALGASRATHGQLVETFRDKYGLAAETQDKAIAFYLQAARYADVPLSPFFKKPRVTTGVTRRRQRKGSKQAPEQEAPESSTTFQLPQGKSMFTVNLSGGGSVTLHGDFDPFGLKPEDRNFVYGLVDSMRTYAEERTQIQNSEDEEMAEDEQED